SPTEVRLTVDPNNSALVLPVRPTSLDDDASLTPSFGEPEGSPPIETIQVEPGEQDWTVSRHLVDMTGKLEVLKDLGVVRFEDIDPSVTPYALVRYGFAARQVTAVRGEAAGSMGWERADWRVQTRARTILTTTGDHFHV